MRRILLLILLLFLVQTIDAQDHWFRFAGGTGYDEATDNVYDVSGDLITCGYFHVGAAFGTTSLASAGLSDIWISKNHPDGTYAWVYRFGALGDDRPSHLTTDAAGNIYVTGYYTQSSTFGAFTLTSSGQQDIFVMKLDPQGQVIWAVSGGGSLNDGAADIDVNTAGDIFITGKFIGLAQFGNISVTSAADTSNNSTIDAFTAKLNSNGQFVWVQKGGGKLTDYGTALCSDASGNVYVTGQFSDTVQFGQVHNNLIYNAIFIIAYDASGNELWFRKASGGLSGIVRDIVCNTNGDIYLAGECQGNFIFFGQPDVTLAGNATYRVFIAHYNNTGSLLWSTADGSSSEISASRIVLVNNTSLILSGTFRCVFTAMAGRYDAGVFNSIGYDDIYVSRYDINGNWSWCRQYGGPSDDKISGITALNDSSASICGSFITRFVYTSTQSTIIYDNQAGVLPATSVSYCNDPDYSQYRNVLSNGSSDAFFGAGVDLQRQPHDFYLRTGTGCARPVVNGCISESEFDNQCTGTFNGCSGVALMANTNTSSQWIFDTSSSVGPQYYFLWSDGSVNKSITAYTSGLYAVTMTSADGCFSSSATQWVTVNQTPPVPWITDNKGINFQALSTTNIDVCIPDTIVLTTKRSSGCSLTWSGPASSTTDTVTYIAVNPGLYQFTVLQIDSNGCRSYNTVKVIASASLAPILPEIFCPDSVSTCGGSIPIYVIDTTNVPSVTCQINNTDSVVWTITPTVQYSQICPYVLGIALQQAATGTYHIEATIYRHSLCGGLVAVDVCQPRDIYIESVAPPVSHASVNNLSGNNTICFGDSLLLSVSGGYNIIWTGPSYVPIADTLIAALLPGSYCVSVTDSNSAGCEVTFNSCLTIGSTPTPPLSLSPPSGIVCPQDSVELTVNAPGGISFDWIGSFSTVTTTTPSVYVTVPGTYYCNVKYPTGCELGSNTVDVFEYTTPSLVSSPPIMCAGDSVMITLISNADALIEWDPPLTDITPSVWVTQPGTYSCQVYSCDIVSALSMTVLQSQLQLSTAATDTLLCSGDSVQLTANTNGTSVIWYPGQVISDTINIYSGGSYIVTVSDANGCDLSDTLIVTEYQLPSISVMPVSTVCTGTDIQLIAVCPAGYITSWTGPGNFTSYGDTVNILNSDSSDAGNYYVHISDSVCSGADSVIQLMIDPLAVADIIGRNVICDSLPVTLSSSFQNSAYNYLWNGPVTGSAASLNVSQADTGLYQLIVYSGVCPADTDTVSVHVIHADVPVVSASQQILCTGDSIILSVAGYPGAVTWMPLNIMDTSVVINTPGLYFVSFTDQNGCTGNSDTTNIIEDVIPVSSIISNSPLCIGDELQLRAVSTPGYNFSWTGPAGFTSTLNPVIISGVSLQSAGNYSVTLSDAICSGQPSTVFIDVDTFPSYNWSGTRLVCFGESLVLDAHVSNDVSVSWTGPQFSSVKNIDTIVHLNSNSAGTYYVQLVRNACITLDSVVVSIDDCIHDPVNIFTPNNDGINDYFFPQTGEPVAGQLNIYNRWGDLIEVCDGLKGWDGKNKSGKDLPEGVYYFDFIGIHYRLQGVIELTR